MYGYIVYPGTRRVTSGQGIPGTQGAEESRVSKFLRLKSGSRKTCVMIYPAYSIQALRWKPLSSIRDAANSHAAKIESHPSLRGAYENLKQTLQEKHWLLEENQHLVVPPTHLDDYQGRIYSMGDFYQACGRSP